MKYILAIDFGLKKIGTAIANTLDKYPSAFHVFEVKNNFKTAVNNLFLRIKNDGYELEKIVIGFPKFHYYSDIQKAIKLFKQLLEQRFNLPIILVDESNTTSAVKDKLITMDLKHKDFKKAKDTLAAVLILERFFQNYH